MDVDEDPRGVWGIQAVVCTRRRRRELVCGVGEDILSDPSSGVLDSAGILILRNCANTGT